MDLGIRPGDLWPHTEPHCAVIYIECTPEETAQSTAIYTYVLDEPGNIKQIFRIQSMHFCYLSNNCIKGMWNISHCFKTIIHYVMLMIHFGVLSGKTMDLDMFMLSVTAPCNPKFVRLCVSYGLSKGICVARDNDLSYVTDRQLMEAVWSIVDTNCGLSHRNA